LKLLELVIRVSRVRTSNPLGRGGVIFSGRAINDGGEIIDGKTLYVVKAAYNVIGVGLVEPGQWWRVSGTLSKHERIVDNYKFSELQMEAAEAVLVRPSGEHLITLMAESPDFEGIGYVKARRLWERFGTRLYDILDASDAGTLTSVLSPEVAHQTVAAWTQFGHSKTLQWLHAQGFSTALGRKLIAFFGPDTANSVEDDPYRLLSFCAGWREVDALATGHFGLACDDKRRLKGAVEEALYRVFAAGHTATAIGELDSHLSSLLGAQRSPKRWRLLASDAIDEGFEQASFIVGPTGLIHPVGPLVMELTIARAIAGRLADDGAGLMGREEVEALIDDYEATLSYPLTLEQRSAVQLAAGHRFALLVGGAGVGKTTVLQTVYQIYDANGVAIYQMALAGRAAKRMQEVTGRSASTIAGFLRKVASLDWSGPAVVVVDEASMLDVITMSKLCEALPSHVRILLAGDPSQLMPVGPGLVLHTLVNYPGVPVVELTAVKRYGGLIAKAAQDVRAGRWPVLSEDVNESIAFLPCKRSGITNLVVSLYDSAPAETQVLCAKRNGTDGVKSINAACQARYTKDGEPLTIWNEEFNQQQGTGLYLNDLVMCSRNRWDIGVQNGSLGRLVSIEQIPFIDPENDELGKVLGGIEWDDGVIRPLFESMLDDLELGYAITVHKAQGSQWPVVVIPLTANRLLDRTLIYTAMTRARIKVILVGEPVAAKAAVEAMPKSHYRKTGLEVWLEKAMTEALLG
jgi:exodeoxyribonuclease V alpha subunit